MSEKADRVGRFVDIETGEVLDESIPWDVHGVDFIGGDEDGLWWGTDRAAWVLSEQSSVVTVSGYLGAEAFVGYFIGTEGEARDWAERRRIEITDLESEG